MNEFPLTGEYIELDQLLKAAQLCNSGGEARGFIRDGLVSVDGETELRLRRKIRPGMTVEFDGTEVRVTQ